MHWGRMQQQQAGVAGRALRAPAGLAEGDGTTEVVHASCLPALQCTPCSSQGNTAVYQLYAHARIASIVRKSGERHRFSLSSAVGSWMRWRTAVCLLAPLCHLPLLKLLPRSHVLSETSGAR